MSEEFTKALHSSGFLLGDIREAYCDASNNNNPLICQLLEPLISKAVEINQDLKRIVPYADMELVNRKMKGFG